MKPGGVVIVVVGVWLGVQIFGGDMLERLGVVSRPGAGGAHPTAATGAGSVLPA